MSTCTWPLLSSDQRALPVSPTFCLAGVTGKGEYTSIHVFDCLVNEVECVKYEGSVWMKVLGERGRSALYIRRVCVYMPTDSS